MVLALARVVISVVGLVVLYYVLPFDHLSNGGAVLFLTLGLLGISGLLAVDVRAILKAQYPGIRAIESLATLLPLFLLLFATLYYLLERARPHSFTQPLSRTDSLYFTITTFATVGYGDITPVTTGARVAVMFQMMGDLIVIGVGIKALAGAAQIGNRRRASGDRVDGS